MNNDTLKAIIVFTKNAEKLCKAYTDAVIAAFPRGLIYQGAVDYYSFLPTDNQEIGDTYTVRYKGGFDTVPDGTEYAWGEYEGVNQWIPLGPNITGKADKVPEAVAGHLAALDSNGNLTDSGKNLGDLASVSNMTLKITTI